MRRAFGFMLIAVTGVAVLSRPVRAGEITNYVYKLYDAKTDEVLKTALNSVTVLEDGILQVHHTIEGNEDDLEEIYRLDGSLATQSWSIRDAQEKLDYDGFRKGNTLHFKGQMNNKTIEKTVAVDDNPVCNHPKITLSRFALSGREDAECWGIRKTTLDLYKMIIKKVGEETVEFGGQPVQTVKVYFAPKNILFSKFYQRTFYFRKSDGLLIKSDRHDGQEMELVVEEDLPVEK